MRTEGTWDRMVRAAHEISDIAVMLTMLTISVRISAKELSSLILDEDRLRIERQDRKSWKSRVTGIEEFGPPDMYGEAEGSHPSRVRDQRARRQDEEELEYRLAIEASKNEAEEERKRRERNLSSQDEDDLAKAIKLSKEEEDSRRRELEESNAASLFDDTPSQTVPQPTGYNQGYQQQGAVDWFGNPIDAQQQQNTGYLNNMYTQPTGVTYQQTGYQNGADYPAFQQQPQPTGFDQFQQQQQANYLQSQQTAFNMNNPYAQQATEFGDLTLQQQQQNAQNAALQAGSNNPWSSNGLQQSTDALKPAPTGSNNPFASSLNRPSSAHASRPPTLSTLQEQKTQSQFSNSLYNPPTSFISQEQPIQAQPQKELDPHRAQLNALLATGEGQDTFGNVGQLRIPAQHTAPGTFVNSAGVGASRLVPNQTGANPFLNSQFTGFQPQTRIAPAQTGPAGAFGANSNPFGASPFSQQQPGQAQQGGSLIDL